MHAACSPVLTRIIFAFLCHKIAAVRGNTALSRVTGSVRAACKDKTTGSLHSRGVLFKAARFAELVSGSILAGAADAAGEGEAWHKAVLLGGLQEDGLSLVRVLCLHLCAACRTMIGKDLIGGAGRGRYLGRRPCADH